jgi:hypothetical protein
LCRCCKGEGAFAELRSSIRTMLRTLPNGLHRPRVGVGQVPALSHARRFHEQNLVRSRISRYIFAMRQELDVSRKDSAIITSSFITSFPTAFDLAVLTHARFALEPRTCLNFIASSSTGQSGRCRILRSTRRSRRPACSTKFFRQLCRVACRYYRLSGIP